MVSKVSKEAADKGADVVSECVEALHELGLEQDYAAYLLLTAGMGLAVMGNRRSPIVTTQILASAMMVANHSVIEMEDEEEKGEGEDGTYH